MRILVAVAVILVLVLIISLVWAYRHRSLAKDHASGQWTVHVRSLPGGWVDGGKHDWLVDLIKVTPNGYITDRTNFAYVIGADVNFDQKLASYKMDAEARAFTLNGLDTKSG